MREIQQLHSEDVQAVLRLLPWQAFDALMRFPCFLAGGAIRDRVSGGAAKDLDLFCRTREEADSFAAYYGEYKRTTFANTLKRSGFPNLPIQFVHYREFIDAEDLISQFDFLACAAAIFYDKQTARFVGVSLEGFYEDCAEKRLTFLQQPKDKGSLIPLKRAMHLAERGWKLPDDGLANILVHFEPVLALKPERLTRALRPSSYGGRR